MSIYVMMASSNTLSASWHLVTLNKQLARSSQAVSNVDRKVFIFGGELLPRQPVGNRIDVVTIDSVQGKLHTSTDHLIH